MKNYKTLVTASAIFLSANANAALFERLGGQAYYDDTLNVTWLADANYSQTSGYDDDGLMSWDESQSWINSLNSVNHIGFSDWRLPTWTDTNEIGCFVSFDGTDCGYNVKTGTAETTVYSEMASLWTDTLGNIALYDREGNFNPPGAGFSNPGPFGNFQDFPYWLGVEYPKNSNEAMLFNPGNGYQAQRVKTNNYYAFAVRTGDVNLVPIPPSFFLFGSGLILLIKLSKRNT